MQPMEPSKWQGHYFDGRTPVRHEVTVTVAVGGLQIQKGDAETLWWPYEQVRQAERIGSSGQVRLDRGEGYLESLVVSDPQFLTALQHMVPRWAPEFGKAFGKAPRERSQLTVILLCAAAAVAVVWLLYTWAIPAITDVLADYVPASWEEKLGLAVTEQLAPPEARCADSELNRALDEIASTLLAAEGPRGEIPYTFHITVADRAEVNAFAGPGGYIVILRGLLKKTETPEELAGVLAHEMQHILQRHPTRAVLREMSTSSLIAVLSGNAEVAKDLLQAAGMLGELRYTRRDEAAADRAGMRMLQAAQINPQGLIEFLGKMDGGNSFQYFSTHPNTDERIRELRTLAAEAPFSQRELLPGYRWAEVRNRCEPNAGR